MNKTIATKITTRSNGPSVRATRTGATFSEIMAFWSARAAMRHPSRPGCGHAPHQPSIDPSLHRPVGVRNPDFRLIFGRKPLRPKGLGDVLGGNPGPGEADAGSGRAALGSIGG